MAQAWARDAWSLESARVLGPEVGSAVQTNLDGMVDQIGFGWSDNPGRTKHWKPLPRCAPGATVGSYTPDMAIHTSADLEAIVKGLCRLVPKVGPLLSGIVGALWPSTGEDAFEQLVSAAVYDLVSEVLVDLKNVIEGSPGSWETLIANWQSDC